MPSCLAPSFAPRLTTKRSREDFGTSSSMICPKETFAGHTPSVRSATVVMPSTSPSRKPCADHRLRSQEPACGRVVIAACATVASWRKMSVSSVGQRMSLPGRCATTPTSPAALVRSVCVRFFFFVRLCVCVCGSFRCVCSSLRPTRRTDIQDPHRLTQTTTVPLSSHWFIGGRYPRSTTTAVAIKDGSPPCHAAWWSSSTSSS